MSDDFPTYFQFPLRYITDQPNDHKSMAKKMMNDCMGYAAWRWSRQSNPNEIALRAGRYRKMHPELGSVHHMHNQWLAAANALGFVYPKGEDFKTTQQYASTVFEKDHKDGGWQVRLRSDIFWNIIEHESTWPPMKIRVLCALYAIVGHQQAGYAQVTHLLLRAVASGFKGPKQAGAAKLIPESTVRYWLDQLHQRSLFRVCEHRGRRYYAIAHCETDEQLAKWVLKNETEKRQKKHVIKTSELQPSQSNNAAEQTGPFFTCSSR